MKIPNTATKLSPRSQSALKGINTKEEMISFLTRKGLSPNEASKEISKGMQVESEHIANPKTQMRIAFDHLVESPKYYRELAKMESKLK